MSNPETLHVAVAQIESVPGDLDANLRKHLDLIDAARAAGAGVLLFPELSLTGHCAGPDALRLAIGRGDPRVLQLARAAGPMSTVFGVIEEAPAAQFYNSAFVVRDGALAHVHRKINLATYGRLDDGKHFGGGAQVETLSIAAGWRASVLICADTWNPALVHLAALQGSTLLLVPVSSGLEAVGAEFDNPAGWDTNLRFHALTYGMPVMMANRVGTEDGLTFWGGSRILDPFGRVVAGPAGTAETLLRAQLDFDDVRRARFLLPTVRDANTALVLRELERVQRAAHSTQPPPRS
ncbi:MAG: nitrilase-related carbon-nitrogen hydrolase [Casimicrobiaceae bacterium]